MTKITDFQEKIRDLFPKIDMLFNEPMEKHTSFRIGGPAEVLLFPKSVAELSDVLKKMAALQVRPRILGAGTNVLAPDDGLPGLTICLKDALEGMEELEDGKIRVAGGVTMARAAVFAASRNLGGMEFAHGIPGTVGGGVFMNAGAYGGEIKDICCCVDVLSMDGELSTLTAAEMDFSYRHSRLEEESGVVVSAVFQLTAKPEAEIRACMQELMCKRKNSQPLDMPSAGSAFKRPTGGYASALIDEAGLRGFQVGGAAVSQKHTGFAVNMGHATAEDVRSLLQQVSDRVYERSGIRLEPEVRIW